MDTPVSSACDGRTCFSDRLLFESFSSCDDNYGEFDNYGRIMADVTPAAGTCRELGPCAIAGMVVGAGWYGGGASEPSPVLAGALWGTQWQH